uniref:Uncharacterized protein n=1 Tax=Pseudo-nitzschia australis TaxID=44445 RepID=A0A7S4AXR2_9STRA|mmetsp:Transcript_27147/g.59756  ORF Transcript_27147/g.59756 Transcript_27147/m.59756 type:complete len:410 (+) Transcript_27147:108-1337(+)|eukprot:CAMPEP_0168169426 /NCGR_PEP_ID=MMETSP0139_2-20121125/3630_1 /TAXON_ID=44445 /ORGANISM="Pseudo-nitzschia australis, Strain 10249 10 AB" /LENGTH=409 /DNA_ID=CAMNT_0008086841 /DNA_START=51 /DNA_END=1280 /DNA_ORIENTATION=+
MATMGRTYIHEGRVLRNHLDQSTGDQTFYYGAPLWKFVEWKRVALILLPVIALWVTNPANRVPSSSAPMWLAGRPRTTNYGLFSLNESIEGVTLLGLLSRWEVCTFGDASTGEFCGILADSMCHRKPLLPWEYHSRQNRKKNGTNNNSNNPTVEYYKTAARNFGSALAEDRVFVAHRFLCIFMLFSAAWKFCCPQFPLSRQILVVSPIAWINDAISSVLWKSTETTLVRDLFFQNAFVYPFLVELNRMLPRLQLSSLLARPTGNETADYALAVVVLVIGIGGGSNALGALIVSNNRRRLVGFSSVAAAALGYAIRVANAWGRSSLYAYTIWPATTTSLGGVASATRELGLVHAYWTYVAWIIVGHPYDWYPRLVVWLLAGLVGSIYGEFHLLNMELNVVRELLIFFGLA